MSAGWGLARECVGRRWTGEESALGADELAAYAEAIGDANPRYAAGGVADGLAGDATAAGSVSAGAGGTASCVGTARSAGTDPHGGRSGRASGQVGHPLAAARALHGVVREVLFDPALGVDLPRLVHGEQDMRFLSLLRPGQRVRPEVHLIAIEAKVSGEVMRVFQRLVCATSGAPVLEAQAAYFIRRPREVEAPAETEACRSPLGDALAVDPAWALSARGPAGSDSVGIGQAVAEGKGACEGGAAEAAGVSLAAEDRRDPHFLVEREMTLAQAERYAAASHDHNPIHVDAEFARQVGLPGPIGHGMNTMAWLASDVIEHCAGGDPGGLARLRLRFSAMVLHGDRLTFRGRRGAEGRVALEVVGPRGEQVVRDASALLRDVGRG